MKLLLDQGLPRTADLLLRIIGFDAVHVGEIGHAAATDEVILQLGRDESRVVVTLDADFHSLLALSNASEPSVIRIRIEGLQGQDLTDLLQAVLVRCGDELERGAAVVVQPERIRIRHLPIRSN